MLIFASSLTLASYRYDQSEAEKRIMEILDYSYTVAFILEMIFRLIGLGPRLYVADVFNILDATIVLMSIVDFILFHVVFD